MAETEENKSDKNQPDKRWWEYYFVRYFVGTVVGSAVILSLNSPGQSSLSGLIIKGISSNSDLGPEKLTILGALGLAFCYVASAPVLVLHAARGVYFSHIEKKFLKSVIGAIILVLLLGGGTWLLNRSLATAALPSARYIEIILAVVFVPQAVLLALASTQHAEAADHYYRQLVSARAVKTERSSQYVESYKHLREHGNAFLILICELVLGYILTVAPTTNFAFIALAAWIIPAAWVWVLGTVLEHRFSKDPL